MGRISATELCQKLRFEAIARQDTSAVNNLRIRILDYLITRKVTDDRFEEVLKGRLDDPDPAKEQSRIICGEILVAWRTMLDKKA